MTAPDFALIAEEISKWLEKEIAPQRIPGRIKLQLPELITKALAEAHEAGIDVTNKLRAKNYQTYEVQYRALETRYNNLVAEYAKHVTLSPQPMVIIKPQATGVSDEERLAKIEAYENVLLYCQGLEEEGGWIEFIAKWMQEKIDGHRALLGKAQSLAPEPRQPGIAWPTELECKRERENLVARFKTGALKLSQVLDAYTIWLEQWVLGDEGDV